MSQTHLFSLYFYLIIFYFDFYQNKEKFKKFFILIFTKIKKNLIKNFYFDFTKIKKNVLVIFF